MKLNLIYYKNIVDLAIKSFISLNEDCFVKYDDRYVLVKQFTKIKLKKLLERCITENLVEIAMSSKSTDDKYILIGSCYPKNNLLLDFKTDSYFPKKLSSFISNNPSIKWMLREHDIEIDMNLMNEIFINIFNEMFNDSKKILKLLGKDYGNVMAVSHSHLDCYALFKTIKWAYGNSNCINVWKDKLHECPSCIVALNDVISRYISNKIEMNRSPEFKRYAHEIKDYLDMKLEIRR